MGGDGGQIGRSALLLALLAVIIASMSFFAVIRYICMRGFLHAAESLKQTKSLDILDLHPIILEAWSHKTMSST